MNPIIYHDLHNFFAGAKLKAGSAESCLRRLPNEIEPEPVIELVQTDSPAPMATDAGHEEEVAAPVAATLPVKDEDGEAQAGQWS